jgi:two-component system OmpR family response regulator
VTVCSSSYFVVSGNNGRKETFMAGKPYYTTFKISQICGVNPTTVQNWIKENKLRAFQTPGGHRRVQSEDLIAFLKKFGMPIPPELDQKAPLIMIVDDETDILDMIGDLMQSEGKDVEVAKAQSGVEALLMIGERKPDLLILDLKMPGMDGYEVCRKLKSSPGTRNIRIVAISGDHSKAVEERIMETGADLFFTKPLDIVEFRKSCFKLLQ